MTHRTRLGALSVGWACATLACVSAHAGEDLSRCAAIPDDAERLKCYDALARSQGQHAPGIPAPEQSPSPSAAPALEPSAPPSAAPALEHTPSSSTTPPLEQSSPPSTTPALAGTGKERSYLAEAWRLGERNPQPITDIRGYRPDYFIVRYTSRANTQPSSPAPDHTTLTPEDLDKSEAKFQLSFKTEVISPATLPHWGQVGFRLWAAYTQQSHWQIFNARNSREFRTTNYEPEFILTADTGHDGRWPKLVNVGLVHQSNGESNPASRSWNRLYVQGGWEWGDFSLLARAWWRLPESTASDDNPDIEDYLGHGDVVGRWAPSGWGTFSLLARYNFRFNPGRGFMQLDWATPVPLPSVRFHVQFTTGYGESLIDYNFRQTTVGVGMSFGHW